MLKLYYAAHTCSLATHIVLEEVGADYSTVRIDFGKAEQRSPEYLEVNPKGRVPALVTDRGVLTETPAMLVFVAQSFPAAGLAPLDDPFAATPISSPWRSGWSRTASTPSAFPAWSTTGAACPYARPCAKQSPRSLPRSGG